MMRFLGTVVSAAILIVLAYLFVGWMVDGYFGGNIVPDRLVPDAWAAPNSWSEWRDILIVFTFVFWMVAGMVMIAVAVALFLLVGGQVPSYLGSSFAFIAVVKVAEVLR